MRQLNKPVQRHTARTNLNGTLNGFVILFFARSLASWLGGTIHLRVMWLLYAAPCSLEAASSCPCRRDDNCITHAEVPPLPPCPVSCAVSLLCPVLRASSCGYLPHLYLRPLRSLLSLGVCPRARAFPAPALGFPVFLFAPANAPRAYPAPVAACKFSLMYPSLFPHTEPQNGLPVLDEQRSRQCLRDNVSYVICCRDLCRGYQLGLLPPPHHSVSSRQPSG